jgi:WD40-like Beta Propeller Repeat
MSSPSTKTAPYGSWKSPITSDLIVAQSVTLSELRLDGGHVYWLEGRPQEQGRYVVVRADADGRPTDITPPTYNARTRVHEYGGGSWTVRNGTVYFSNLADGRLYRQVPGASEPQALTPEPPARERQWRFADGVIDQRRSRWIGVCEDHTVDGEPVNAIVAVDLGDGSGPGHVLASGHDFYASPRLSPDGRWLAWLAWDHPNMPRNGTQLYLGEVAQNGAISDPRAIAGGATESIFQPEWSPDGAQIVLVSDRSGWWNLYSLDLAMRTARALAPMAAEFGLPQWLLGMSTYAFARADRLHLFPGWTRLPRGVGSGKWNAHTGRDAVHGIRLDARCGRSRGVSRRCARPSRQHRGTRSRLRPAVCAENSIRLDVRQGLGNPAT